MVSVLLALSKWPRVRVGKSNAEVAALLTVDKLSTTHVHST